MKRLVIPMLASMAVAACGGSKPPVTEPTPGESQATPSQPGPSAPDVAAPAPGEPVSTEPRPAAPPPDAIAVPAPRPEGTTFELKNEGQGDLNFGITKGWGPVIFAYTGKPPKAKSVILFSSACTASCDAPPDAVCPVCAEPQNKKEERAMARSETAAAGAAVTVPWDGKVLAYDKAPGKKHCKCWKKVEPAEGTYTVKACGLRAAAEAGKGSKPVCAETQVTLGPGATQPQTITLSFPK